MEDILNTIERCLINEEYFGALFLTLVLPDICAALKSSNGKTSPLKYKNWYDQNIPIQNGFKGEDAYRLRCRVLHQGTMNNREPMSGNSGSFSHFIFTLPNDQNIMTNANNLNGMINLDLSSYCKTVLIKASEWIEVNKELEPVRSNLEGVVRVYDNPLLPFINIPNLKGIF